MTIVPPTTHPQQPSILPPLPPLALAVLADHWDSLLDWMGHYQLAHVQQRWGDHVLVRLAEALDWAALTHTCRDYHHTAGPGAPALYPVALLLRAEIVRAFWGACSDRDLEALINDHLLARWFCGLPFALAAPDHTTLHRFHGWLAAEHPTLIFDATLAFLDQHDPQPQQIQIIDTFACAANAADQHPIQVLVGLTAQLRRHLAHLDAYDAALCAWPTPPPLPKNLNRTTAPAHVAIHAADAAQLLDMLAAAALPEPLHARIERPRSALAHVLATDFGCAADGAWYELAHGDKGAFRHGSATDVDASFRKHGGAVCLGYNVAVSTNGTQIRAVVTTTGCTSDTTVIVPVLEQLTARGEALPTHVVMDRAGGSGKVRTQVQAATDGQTQMVAHTPSTGHGSDRFGPEAFVLSSDETCLRCPNGVESTRRYVVEKDGQTGYQFSYLARECAGCPLWENCRDPKAKPTGKRTVCLSPYHATQRVAAAFNTTAEGKQLLRDRWRVERVIAHMVQNAGARYARCRGRVAVGYQMLMAAMVVNMRNWQRRDAHRRRMCAIEPINE